MDVSILSAINTMVQGSENQSNEQFHDQQKLQSLRRSTVYGKIKIQTSIDLPKLGCNTR